MTSDITFLPCLQVRWVLRLQGWDALVMAMPLPGLMAHEMSSPVGLLSALTFGKRLLLRTFVFGIFGHLLSTSFLNDFYNFDTLPSV